MKKVLAILAFVAALAGAVATSGGSGSVAAAGVCSPGQHGNPQPGFKPGSCDNK